ncbi:MAG: hypothetical protein AAFX99_23565, partial [Myxococcota bacterium]
MDEAHNGDSERESQQQPGAVVWGLAGLVVALVVAQSVFYGPRTVDDLFISLRYAAHLVEGYGLVFNPGERVEGYSNPLWVVLQAALLGFGMEGVEATKLLSAVSLVGLLGAVWAAGRWMLGLSLWSAWLAVAAVAANSYVLSWAWLGLETPLYVALMVGYATAMHGCMARPTTERTAMEGFVVGVLALGLMVCRPEGGLFVATLGLALAAEAKGWEQWLDRVKAAVPAALWSVGGWSAFMGARRWYFGRWLPHTFDSKRGAGMAWTKLEPLWAQGTSWMELVALLVGVGAMVGLVVWRRSWVLGAMAASAALFVAAVEIDWMPNHRHMLPIWVALALALAWGAEPLVQRLRGGAVDRWAVGLGAVALVSLVGCAVVQVQIDSRFSVFDVRTHGQGRHWVRWKTAESWENAWRNVQRRVPQRAMHRSVHHHGMLRSLYRVLEHGADPEKEQWYVGQDIGRAGYYSPIRVFDSPGLFTPDAIAPGLHEGAPNVTESMLKAALERRPIVVEWGGPWAAAAGRHAALTQPWAVTAGGPRMPWRLERRGDTPPMPAQLRMRYDRVKAEFPTSFFMATLYGDSAGAMLEARHRWIHTQLDGVEAPFVEPGRPRHRGWAGQGAVLDRRVDWHGCRFEPWGGLAEGTGEAKPGDWVRMTCMMGARKLVQRNYSVFVHLVRVEDGTRVAMADHPPALGVMPTWRWTVGDTVRDTVTFQIPPRVEASEGQSSAAEGRVRLQARVGLFDGNHRAVVQPARL